MMHRMNTKNRVFLDVTQCGSCKNRRDKNPWIRNNVVTASVVPSSPILATLMMEALSSSGTSVLTRATWRNIPGDAIPHSHRRENLKSYVWIRFVVQWYTDEHGQHFTAVAWSRFPTADVPIPLGFPNCLHAKLQHLMTWSLYFSCL
jgi:hypothetical protein